MIVTLLLLCFAPFAVAFAREVRRPSKGFGKGLGRATSETQKESEEGKLDVFGLPPPLRIRSSQNRQEMIFQNVLVKMVVLSWSEFTQSSTVCILE